MEDKTPGKSGGGVVYHVYILSIGACGYNVN